MATRISPHMAADNAGYESVTECLEDVMFGTAHCPACCSEGCEVEIDGTCEHGFPSIARAMGVA